MPLCLCAHLSVSVTILYCNRTAKQIQLVFGMEAFSGLSFTVLQGNLEMRVLPSGTLSQTSYSENFASACRSLQCVVILVRQRWTHGESSCMHVVVCEADVKCRDDDDDDDVFAEDSVEASAEKVSCKRRSQSLSALNNDDSASQPPDVTVSRFA